MATDHCKSDLINLFHLFFSTKMLGISSRKIARDAYDAKLQSVRVLQTPWAARLIVYWMLIIGAVCFVALFLPWQQNIQASGELTALSPSDRPQMVNTAIAGRIKKWMVQEGQLVAEGDTILVLSEIKDKYFDPNMLMRMEEQLVAKEEGVDAKLAKVQALNMQYAALEEGLGLKISQIQQKIEQKRLKIQSDSIALEAAKVDFAIAQRQVEGTQVMYDSGVVALIKLESVRSKFQKAQSTLMEYTNKYASTKNDLRIEQLNLQTIRAEVMEKLAKSRSDRSATTASLQDSKSDLSKLRNDYANMQIRQKQYAVVAPQAGYVVKAAKAGIGEIVKEGDGVISIMPARPNKAVELFVKAMDVSLLDTGRHVRLQFDGWPALQFSGWPSVAVGTFGGKVKVIDLIDSKAGKYRILITPDAEKGDEPWPAQLRIGSGVFGWVMLDDVPVWFEIWRQLNGFPPTVDAYAGESTAKEIENKLQKSKK